MAWHIPAGDQDSYQVQYASRGKLLRLQSQIADLQQEISQSGAAKHSNAKMPSLTVRLIHVRICERAQHSKNIELGSIESSRDRNDELL
ncbi:hypothetical protein BST61_g7853 [Cercospora zeina]